MKKHYKWFSALNGFDRLTPIAQVLPKADRDTWYAQIVEKEYTTKAFAEEALEEFLEQGSGPARTSFNVVGPFVLLPVYEDDEKARAARQRPTTN